MKIPRACLFCGRVNIRVTRENPNGQINYADRCEDCAHPREPRTVLVPIAGGIRRAPAVRRAS